MSTWASVDLPEPLGPMTAWTSPERTVRSMPRRISVPPTAARRPRISRTWPSPVIVHHHHDLAAVDADVVDGHRLRRREDQRLAGLERERAAVLPALQRQLVDVDLALGERDVLVRAGVADRVDVVVDADDGDAVAGDVEPAGLAGAELLQRAERHLGHHASLRANLAATPSRSSGARPATGRRERTSSKKPLTTRRSASSVGTPRLSR